MKFTRALGIDQAKPGSIRPNFEWRLCCRIRLMVKVVNEISKIVSGKDGKDLTEGLVTIGPPMIFDDDAINAPQFSGGVEFIQNVAFNAFNIEFEHVNRCVQKSGETNRTTVFWPTGCYPRAVGAIREKMSNSLTVRHSGLDDLHIFEPI